MGFKNKKPKIKSYNSQKVRNLTYKLAEYDLNHPNKPNLKFGRLASENDKITAYRDEALRQIEKKARNSRNSRRKRLELMKRKDYISKKTHIKCTVLSKLEQKNVQHTLGY